MATARFRVLLIVALLFILVTVIPAMVGFITDWFWFRELGYQAVFTTSSAKKIVLFFAANLIALLFLARSTRYVCQRVAARRFSSIGESI